MNRKQWFVWGIGLILMGIIFGSLSGMIDCLDIQEEYTNSIIDAVDSNMGAEVINGIRASGNAWTISCLDKNMYMALISSISWGLGICFTICGFLEPKKDQVKKTS